MNINAVVCEKCIIYLVFYNYFFERATNIIMTPRHVPVEGNGTGWFLTPPAPGVGTGKGRGKGRLKLWLTVLRTPKCPAMGPS